MRPFWGRLLRHVLVTGVALLIIGHLFGRAFLFVHRIYANGAYDPDNERVLWQTPFVMAGLGMLLTAALDLLIFYVRRPVKVEAVAPPRP